MSSELAGNFGPGQPLPRADSNKIAWVKRTRHETRLVLFNGSDSYNKGLKKLEETFEDDYSEILPVFIYGDPDVAKSIGSEMDRTIKKCSKLISLHSITVKPKVKNSKKNVRKV